MLRAGKSRVPFPMVVLEFFITVDINEYQENFVVGEGGQGLGLTTLPSSCADCLETWVPETPGTHRTCTGIALPFARGL